MSFSDDEENLHDLSLQSDGLALQSETSLFALHQELLELRQRVATQERVIDMLTVKKDFVEKDLDRKRRKSADLKRQLETERRESEELRRQLQNERTAEQRRNEAAETSLRNAQTQELILQLRLDESLSSVRSWQVGTLSLVFLILALGFCVSETLKNLEQEQKNLEHELQTSKMSLHYYEKTREDCYQAKSDLTKRVEDLKVALKEIEGALEELEKHHSDLRAALEHMKRDLSTKQSELLYHKNSGILDHAYQVLQIAGRRVAGLVGY